MDSKHLYPIRYAARRSNLSPHVIRAWEKRYKAVVPHRSAKNRRLYSEDDVQRLQLLKKITDAGHNISQVAQLASSELIDLAHQENLVNYRPQEIDERQPRSLAAQEHFKKCLSAVRNLDHAGLERFYDQAAIDLTRPALLKEVIMPLFEEIGKAWRIGTLKVVNEHMATAVTRNFLVNMLRAAGISDSAPRLLIATTIGQWHDIGALIVALTAAETGWQPVYYGPNLPAEEIASGVKQCGARVVAISITHQLDRQPLIEELRKLRRYLGQNFAIFVGGRAVGDYRQILREISAVYIKEMDQFSNELNRLMASQDS